MDTVTISIPTPIIAGYILKVIILLLILWDIAVFWKFSPNITNLHPRLITSMAKISEYISLIRFCHISIHMMSFLVALLVSHIPYSSLLVSILLTCETRRTIIHELPRRIAAITRYFNALVIFFSIYVIDFSTLVIVHVALHLAYSSTI